MEEFSSTDFIKKVISDQHSGLPNGVVSVCSSNFYVLQTSLQFAEEDHSTLLIEATCNQVNQFGGYTGMAPEDFSSWVRFLAREKDFPIDRILLGGDHLGPNPWKHYRATTAMENARKLVGDYVQAGFRKIHLDTSMSCGDDNPSSPLDQTIIANRTANLCQSAEAAFIKNPSGSQPVYVIGTEVPLPGGAQKDGEKPIITSPECFKETIENFQQTFIEHGLECAWERVVAFVVQPGVEFTNSVIYEYDHNLALQLSQQIELYPGMVFEAHSTDYQKPETLKQMVADHFAIIKVGPALTFAFREAIFSLASIEQELLGKRFSNNLSNLVETMEEVMKKQPEFWKSYYFGNSDEQRLARKFSLSDRIRYYWSNPIIKHALHQLLVNLNEHPIPLTLVSQYLPIQYNHIREGKISNDAPSMVSDHIREILDTYRFACNPDSGS